MRKNNFALAIIVSELSFSSSGIWPKWVLYVIARGRVNWVGGRVILHECMEFLYLKAFQKRTILDLLSIFCSTVISKKTCVSTSGGGVQK